ncbi:MAG: ArsR family transcriptional regulator [Pyrobaculum sp.]
MIDVVLGAPLRIRIIMALWQYGEINVTELANRLKANYKLLAEHIQLLSKYGIVEEKRIGRARLVKLRKEEFIAALAQALVEAEEALSNRLG